MTSPVRVLLVDEDEDVVDVTGHFLEREAPDLVATTVTSAEAAIERVESESFDVVVSDFRMPEMDGLTLAEKICDRDPDLPYVLYTARDRERFDGQLGPTVDGHVRKRTGSEQYAELASLIVDLA